MTTARQVWEGMLTELSKVNAPSLLLHEFNYYFNKAIYQYVNKRYNIYDTNQQTTDDLRVLKSTATLPAIKCTDDKLNRKDAFANLGITNAAEKVLGATYEVVLPDDYLHMLNCVCVYQLTEAAENCYDKDDILTVAATRLTADSWSVLINDYYNRPSPWKPYYYIHNRNKKTELPTNIFNNDDSGSTDQTPNIKYPELVLKDNGKVEDADNRISPPTEPLENDEGTNDKFSLPIEPFGKGKKLRENPGLTRHANPSKVRCEIRYGQDDKVYALKGVLIDYIKAPQRIRLTNQQVDLTTDTSQIMEFPDYVCQEIINELTMLVMARVSDPRLQTQIGVTQSIANPQQQPQSNS